jgi:hypothetical protein
LVLDRADYWIQHGGHSGGGVAGIAYRTEEEEGTSMKTLRQLAREFVIFGLVAGFVGGVVGFVSQYRELHPQTLLQPGETLGPVVQAPADPLDKLGTRAKPAFDPYAGIATPIAAPPRPSVWKNAGDYLLVIGWTGLIGMLVGFALWVFYRTVRFAVKG